MTANMAAMIGEVERVVSLENGSETLTKSRRGVREADTKMVHCYVIANY